MPPRNEERLAEGIALAEMAARNSPSAYIWDTLAEAYTQSNRRNMARQAAFEAYRLAKAGQELGTAPISYYRNRMEQMTSENHQTPLAQ